MDLKTLFHHKVSRIGNHAFQIVNRIPYRHLAECNQILSGFCAEGQHSWLIELRKSEKADSAPKMLVFSSVYI